MSEADVITKFSSGTIHSIRESLHDEKFGVLWQGNQTMSVIECNLEEEKFRKEINDFDRMMFDVAVSCESFEEFPPKILASNDSMNCFVFLYDGRLAYGLGREDKIAIVGQEETISVNHPISFVALSSGGLACLSRDGSVTIYE